MGCFARNSALRAALDPATDGLLFDIVINDLARGRIAARQPRTHCAPAHRHLSLVWVDFVSMLRMVLRLRSAEKSKKASKINDVTLLQMESGFFCAVQKASVKVGCGGDPGLDVDCAQNSVRILVLAGTKQYCGSRQGD